MRVRAVANGNVVDLDDEAARILIAAGIYEPVEDEPVKAKQKK